MCVFEDDNPFTLRLIASPSLNACFELVNKEAFARTDTINTTTKDRSIIDFSLFEMRFYSKNEAKNRDYAWKMTTQVLIH